MKHQNSFETGGEDGRKTHFRRPESSQAKDTGGIVGYAQRLFRAEILGTASADESPEARQDDSKDRDISDMASAEKGVNDGICDRLCP